MQKDITIPVMRVDEVIPLTPLGIETGLYTFVYTYPLRREMSYQEILTTGMTYYDILVLGAKHYALLVKDHPEHFWAHRDRDLFFEGLQVDDEMKVITFSIGS